MVEEAFHLISRLRPTKVQVKASIEKQMFMAQVHFSIDKLCHGFKNQVYVRYTEDYLRNSAI